ncbi:hypothetical protein FOL47_010876 [Perkinsus chesapeaki]|uniref:Uncharacterized protein n=1 Tax=Perkinsus chesapeaki TaxID=330153 RepID=A0A7J6MNK7_PERCH|nr:hypothetical protein FOL47_010876 [Perkinsus chesapeaki]
MFRLACVLLTISLAADGASHGVVGSSTPCGHPDRSVHECHYDFWDLEKSEKTCCPDEMEAWTELKRKERYVEICVIIVIILLTILFDAVKELLIKLAEKRSNHILVSIINSVNSEFATLGFVALLFGFVENRLQALGPINDHVFGDHLWVKYGAHAYATLVADDLEEHHGPHCLSHLSLLFETVHFLIFYLMIGFIFVCLAFSLSVLRHARTWDRAEQSDFAAVVKEYFSTSPSELKLSGRTGCHVASIAGYLAFPWILLLLLLLVKWSLSRAVASLRPSYEEMFEAVTKDSKMTPSTLEQLHAKAPYSSEGAHFRPNGWFMGLLRGTKVPTMHENIFFFQKHGPTLAVKTLQVICFATALYSGCLVFRLLAFTAKRWRRYWFLLPVGSLPVLIIVFNLFPGALERLVLCTSVCQMKRMRVIMEVKKLLEAQQCELCLNLLRNVKLLSIHYRLTSAPEAERNRLRRKLESVYEKASPHTKSLYSKIWKRLFAGKDGQAKSDNIRSSLAAAGVTGQAASILMLWIEASDEQLELREFCVMMVALRVAENNAISEEDFCSAIHRALPSQITGNAAKASETYLFPDDVRNILEEFKVVHPRSHVLARHMSTLTSANRFLEVEERSGHDVHSPLSEAVMLVTAIENHNIYVRSTEGTNPGDLQVSLLEFARYFIKLDIYQTHDSQNWSAEPFDHMDSVEFAADRPQAPM